MRRPLPFDYRGERPRASSSEAEAFELRLASVVDAERARLLAIGEGHQELGQLGVGAVRGDEARDIVAPVPTASLAPDRKRRLADVGDILQVLLFAILFGVGLAMLGNTAGPSRIASKSQSMSRSR